MKCFIYIILLLFSFSIELSCKIENGPILILLNKKNVQNQDTIYDVIQVAGQSNANGYGTVATLPAGYSGSQDSIQIWWTGDYLTYPVTGHFENMEVPNNTRHRENTDPANPYYSSTGWGVEQRITHNLVRDNGKKAYVIKSTRNGQAINQWDVAGSLWVEWSANITNAISYFNSNNINTSFPFVCWLQGESDIGNGTSYYIGKLDNLMNRYWSLSAKTTNTVWYLFNIPGDFWGDRSVINNAFDTLAVRYPTKVKIVETYPYFTFHYNVGGHYTGNYLLELSQLMYDMRYDQNWPPAYVPVQNPLNVEKQHITVTADAYLTQTDHTYGNTTDANMAVGYISSTIGTSENFRLIIERGQNYGGTIGLYNSAAGVPTTDALNVGIKLSCDSRYVQKVYYGTGTNTTTLVTDYDYYCLKRVAGTYTVEASDDLTNWTEIATIGTHGASSYYRCIVVQLKGTKVYNPQYIAL